MEHLRTNLDKNKELIGDRAKVEKLVWGNMQDIAHIRETHKSFDVVIGSDILYDPRNYQNLLSTILPFTDEQTLIILGGTKRQLEKQFLKMSFLNLSVQDLESKNMYIFISIDRRIN